MTMIDGVVFYSCVYCHVALAGDPGVRGSPCITCASVLSRAPASKARLPPREQMMRAHIYRALKAGGEGMEYEDIKATLPYRANATPVLDKMIAAGEVTRLTYKYGTGHGSWQQATGYLYRLVR